MGERGARPVLVGRQQQARLEDGLKPIADPQNHLFTVAKAPQSVAEEMSVVEEGQPFTPRTLLLASVAHQRELLSEQQIASMLELNLVEVRKALAAREDGGEIVLELAE